MEEESQNSVADSQTFDQSQPIDAVKKKRGRPPRVHAPPVKMIKEEDEDVCFICFDGGSLVLCDRRGCPKAYHPACVKRDEAFFQSKAKWTCGDKGFCTVCLKTIMLIENDGQGKDEKAQVDFDDKTSWEYLFKVYWVYLKGKLSLTVDELTLAKNPSKGPETTLSVSPSTCVHNVDNDLKSIKTDTPPQVLETSETKRRKKDEQMVPHKETVSMKKLATKESSSVVVRKDWATKELLDFVAHMKNGDTSVISQFDVQELMLEYIKRNNLRDPKKKSQIICDSRLKILFGKPRVGHFEMLKLLEFHFFMQEDLSKNKINSIAKQADPDWNSDNIVTMSSKKRKNHKKVEERAPQNKLDEYAAIDIHNINLVYLRRKVMENLIGDSEEFNKKVVGAIVRIRITSKDQKHDIYRLVRVVGTSKADAPYKVGGKSADVMLEVLNLDKKETVSIDAISNQDLSEDECRRLRQSIKCGLVKRFTVGEIQDKAVSLQYARLNDILEAETLRLNNLRDRASEKGHKKRYPLMIDYLLLFGSLTNITLREYVEKLQLLKTPEERERRMREIPDVHSDPKMNPDYETDDSEEYSKKEDEQTKPKFDSRKNTSTPKKPAEFSNNVSSRSWKNEKNKQLTIKSEEDRMTTRKDAHGIKNNSGRPQNQVESNGSTITNWNHRTTGSSSFPNTASETATTSSMRNTPISNVSEIDKVWYYRDPSGKVQGPFCMVQLQKWSTTGYFPTDMRIWINREDESLLLTDVLKEQLQKKTATEKVGIRIEGLTVRTTNLLSDGQSSSGQSLVHNWNTSSFAKSNESTGQLKMQEMASPTPIENSADNKPVSLIFAGNTSLDDLPSPTPNKMTPEGEKVENTLKEQSLPSSETLVREAENSDVGRAHLPKLSSETLVPEAGNTAGWSNGLSQDVGGAQLPKPASEDMVRESGNPSSCNNDSSREVGGSQLPKTAEEWSGYSPTQVKQGERHPGLSQDIGGAQLPKQSSEILVQDSGNDGSWNNGSRQDVGGAQVPKSSSETLVQEAGNETGWNNNSRQDGGVQLSKTADEWSGYSPTRVKKQEWHPEDDHVATTTIGTEQTISSAPPSSQPEYNSYMPPWQGVRETIEFSTLAEESVSDLLAEVDAMESQNGFPSPTSRRNNFAEDIFNGSFEEFSPTPVHGARSNGFSSNGIDIQLPFKWPEIARENITKDIQVTTHSSEVQPPSQDMIDVNNSIKSVEGESQTKVGNVQIEEESVSMRPDHDASKTSQDREGCSNEQKESECTQPASTKSEDPSSEKVRVDHSDMMTDNVTLQSAKVDAVGPPPPSISLTIGSDQVYPQDTLNNLAQPAPEFTTRANTQLNPSQDVTFGWDPHQRYNNDSLRERGYSVEDSGYSRNGKPWVRQSLFGSGSGVINGGVSYSRPPPKGQRVCKFYESGRCKRGASCNYWHP
ncbi:zinc finger CCCH domain-containing protein 44-like protein [Tanacetum coccineum]